MHMAMLLLQFFSKEKLISPLWSFPILFLLVSDVRIAMMAESIIIICNLFYFI